MVGLSNATDVRVDRLRCRACNLNFLQWPLAVERPNLNALAEDRSVKFSPHFSCNDNVVDTH